MTLWDHSRIKKPVATWVHEDGVSCLALGINEIYTGGRDGVIKIVDVRTQQVRGELRGHADWVSKLAILYEGGKQWVLSSSHDGTVRQWSSERLACVNTFNAHHGAINDMKILQSGVVFTAGADKNVKSFTPKVGKRTISSRIYAGHNDEVLCIEPLHGDCIASGDADGNVLIWDVSEFRAVGQLAGEGGTLRNSFSLSDRKVTSLSSYGTTLACATWDPTVTIFEFSSASL